MIASTEVEQGMRKLEGEPVPGDMGANGRNQDMHRHRRLAAHIVVAVVAVMVVLHKGAGLRELVHAALSAAD